MKTNILKTSTALLLLVAFFFLSSCEGEYKPNCEKGGCKLVNIKGAVYVKPSGTGLENIPVEVTFGQRKLASGKTDENGEFNFYTTIDTTSFGIYTNLNVTIPKQKNCFSIPQDAKRIFRSFDEESLKNINFVFYNMASLTINLNRTQTDVFDRFNVTTEFVDEYVMYNWYFIKNPNQETSSWHVVTPADVYTRIWWQKMLDGKEIFISVDSLICRQNENNVFNINY